MCRVIHSRNCYMDRSGRKTGRNGQFTGGHPAAGEQRKDGGLHFRRKVSFESGFIHSIKLTTNWNCRYYLHGTTWHPVMGPFGPMDCVICECKSGRIECHRLECPSRQALNCDRPVKVAGRCCPVCPLEADTSGPISPSATVTRDASRTSTHVTRPRTNATHSRSSATSSSSGKSSSSRHSGALSLCLPSDHDVMVYRAQGGGNASEYIQVIRLSLKFTVVALMIFNIKRFLVRQTGSFQS